MNALTLLKQDHANVEALFARFEKVGADDVEEKTRVAELVIEHLATHAVIEEQVLYPALRDRLPEDEFTVLEALEEHHAAKMMLKELEKTPATHERFDAKFTVLIENVRHHVQEEEDELFAKARDAFTVQELEEMGDALAQAKEAAPTRPHPFAPDTPPLNIIVGLPVAILDRVITTGKRAVTSVLTRR
ncbi:MAG TPA: hemerythrin domain-containing protein [Acidimicrobiales bacterium]|nr:hemerythrin domain-containing protein [Acidimicrobiales bacterium]